MNNIRPFQIVLIGVFAATFVFAILFFALFKGSTSNVVKGYGDHVIVWGTLDQSAFDTVIKEVSDSDKDFSVVEYHQFDPSSFDNALLNAIAENRSPDLIVMPSDDIIRDRAKVVPITYDTITKRTFQDSYIDGANIFMLKDGIYGLPFAVDPLVMYWNKDLYSTAGLAQPPTTWEQVIYQTTPALTVKAANLDIQQSAFALGEYANITNAKDIVSMLFLQAGSTIVDETDTGYAVSLLTGGNTNSIRPADAALSFYTQFALPSNATYTWNRSLPNDRYQFLGGKLATYFGFASELPLLLNGNANLHVDAAPVPQGTSATVHRAFGRFYAFAIPRAATNKQGAFKAMQVLANATEGPRLAELLSLAPVHRAEIARGTLDPFRKVFYAAALTAQAWLDPDPVASQNVFKQLIEDVTSGRARATQSVADMAGRLRLLFPHN